MYYTDKRYRFYRKYLGYRLHIIHLRYILLEIGIAGRGFCLPPTGIWSSRIQDKMRTWDISQGEATDTLSCCHLTNEKRGLRINRPIGSRDSIEEEPPNFDKSNMNGQSQILLNLTQVSGSKHPLTQMAANQFRTNKRCLACILTTYTLGWLKCTNIIAPSCKAPQQRYNIFVL